MILGVNDGAGDGQFPVIGGLRLCSRFMWVMMGMNFQNSWVSLSPYPVSVLSRLWGCFFA
jgi:hypothetical protein